MTVPSGPRPVRAPRGPELHTRGWQQEAALRMLMNNLDPENAEHPDDLVVYGGTGRAARSWEAFDAIVRTLKTLGDEIMFVTADPESGAEVALRLVHEQDPMVPGMRAGLATGDVVTRRGDVYGSVVNLASRLTDEALPGTVLCDRSTADALAGHDGFWLEQQPERAVRGVGRVAPLALERLADPYL